MEYPRRWFRVGLHPKKQRSLVPASMVLGSLFPVFPASWVPGQTSGHTRPLEPAASGVILKHYSKISRLWQFVGPRPHGLPRSYYTLVNLRCFRSNIGPSMPWFRRGSQALPNSPFLILSAQVRCIWVDIEIDRGIQFFKSNG